MINRKHFYFGVFIILLLNLVWLFLGQDSYILIHDNLDSEFIYIKHILESGNILGFDLHGQIDSVMNGINRYYYRSGFNLTILLFYIFPPFVAYVFNHALVHLFGFIGMYLLLKKHFVKENDWLVLSVALIFGFVSYYHTQYGISISGQPLLLLAFLNILNSKKALYNWFVIFIFPFFSFLPVTLPFFIPFLFLMAINFYWNKRKIPIRFLIAILMIVVVNFLVEFNLFYSMLVSENVSHRSEFNSSNIIGGISFLNQLYSSLKITHYHAGKMSVLPVIGAIILSLFYKVKLKNESIQILCFLLLIILIPILVPSIKNYFGDHIRLLKLIQFDRFYFLAPMLWLLLLASVLKEFNWQNYFHKYSAIILLLIIARGVLKHNSELKENIKIILKKSNKPTYSQFFAEDLFNDIKNYLDSESVNSNYNVISIGMHPSITQFNNFNTLDSYQNNYSLDYKHNFRIIIAEELNKNPELQTYYDHWGSRCYAYSSKLGKQYLLNKNSNIKIPVPQFNWDVFNDMNGRYIFSAVPIHLEKDSRITFLKSFESDESFWKIWLYKVN